MSNKRRFRRQLDDVGGGVLAVVVLLLVRLVADAAPARYRCRPWTR